MRPGWKSSSASIFSPTPISLIGLPVAARIESAAPPRPSPSTRVRTMPVISTRWSKARARLTASWPVSASATSRISCGLAAALIAAVSAISSSSTMGAAGGIEDDDVVAAELAPRAARGGRWRPGSRWRRSAGVSTPTCSPRTRSCSLAAGRRVVEGGEEDLLALLLLEALGDLAGHRGLAGALEADHQDADRGRGR